MIEWKRLLLVGSVLLGVIAVSTLRSSARRKRFERGRKLVRQTRTRKIKDSLRWGPTRIPKSAATQHFLAVGTTGSGKSLVQRLLMRDALSEISPGSDRRALILDAKNDALAFIDATKCSCPVYTLNPFDGRGTQPISVSWDIAADITSASRALNLAAALIPSEKGGNNQYFTDAARMVVSAVIESFIRHSPAIWTFSDLVFATLSMERTKALLQRDAEGKEVLANFLGDERTGYQVFTTVVSRMSYFRSIAGLWQKTSQRLSLREWLSDDSILLLGVDATARAALDAINEIVFRVIVEEIDVQSDSESRRTWVWIDEARLSGPLLRGEMLPYLAVKGRSRGACLVLAFQDIEGFREAAGSRIAHELVAQCSHKALLRLESEESASWASKLLGQHEVLEHFRSTPSGKLAAGSSTEHLSRRDAVLPSEFYMLPTTSRKNGLTGFFVSPAIGALRGWISPVDLRSVVPDGGNSEGEFVPRNESDQSLTPWTDGDLNRLRLCCKRDRERKPSLKLKRNQSAHDSSPGNRSHYRVY